MAILAGDTDITGADAGYFFNHDATQAATRFVAAASGTAETGTIVIRASADDLTLKVVVWADSAGSPGALLGVTAEIDGVGSTGEKTASFGATFSIVSGTAYWIGFISADATFNAYGKLDVGMRGREDLSAGVSTPTDPFGTATFTDNPPAKGIPVRIDGTASGGTDETVTVPAHTTLGDFPVPVFQAGSTVTSPAMDATGDFPASEMHIGSDVAAPAALTFGDFPVPVVTGSGNADVTAPPATGLGDFPAPTALFGFTVAVPAHDVLGDFPVSTVSATTSATVTSPAADATGDFPVPGVDDGVAPLPRVPVGFESSAVVRDSGRTFVPGWVSPETSVPAAAMASSELVYA